MKNIITLFDEAITKNLERNHNTLYIAVDAHGTFLRPTKRTVFCEDKNGGPGTEVQCEYREVGKNDKIPHFDNEFMFYPGAKEVLVQMSNCPWIKLILWTSTRELDKLEYQLDQQGINFDYTLENPDFKGTQYANFDYKFFFDILLDDKAGFNAENDWVLLGKYFNFAADSMKDCKADRKNMAMVEGTKLVSDLAATNGNQTFDKDKLTPEMVSLLAMLGLKYFSDLQGALSQGSDMGKELASQTQGGN